MRAAMARATRKAARASGGRPVPAENLHVTLAFLGSVAERQLPRLAQVAAAASALATAQPPQLARAEAALGLAFDQLDYWHAAELLCAVPAAPPARTASLAHSLQELLTAAGLAPDGGSSGSVGTNRARSFRPHVTLARKVHRPPRMREMRPVIWTFADFVLVDSKTLPEGPVYTVLERFSIAR